ncbi:MAG: hypothetical protein AABZ64_11150 [Nitrospinota bacterium]
MDETASAAAPSPAGEPVIEVRRLETYYGDRHILKDVSFDIHRGEIFVILGGSVRIGSALIIGAFRVL